jgi:hypothetical protein
VSFDSSNETFAVTLAPGASIAWGEVVFTLMTFEAEHDKVWSINLVR